MSTKNTLGGSCGGLQSSIGTVWAWQMCLGVVFHLANKSAELIFDTLLGSAELSKQFFLPAYPNDPIRGYSLPVLGLPDYSMLKEVLLSFP
jgi:hypothetical protein